MATALLASCSQKEEYLEPQQPNNVIYYTSSDGNVVTPYAMDVFGANIVSNEYVDGQGIITFDGAVTSLGDMCFFECSSMTSITIPNSVTSLGGACFWYCINLTSITIPDGVTSLGDYCFYECDSLKSITIPDGVTSLGEECFSWCSSLTSIKIPDSVTSLGEACFWYCTNLESFYGKYATPDGRALVKDNVLVAFAPYGLTSYSIPDGVTSLGTYCFSVCRSLTSITIPDSVTSLGFGCFSDCSSLKSITIPDSVTSLGNYCFQNCSGLTSITVMPATPPTGSSSMFYRINNDCPIYVPAGSVDAYKTAEYWSDYAYRIQAISK